MTVALSGIPVLETERLILRGPNPHDEAGYVAFMMSERSQYVGGPQNRFKAWRTFAMEIGHWAVRGYGMWAVTMKGDDTCLGYVGCWNPGGWPEPELGWTLWPEAEGKSIGYEAALAARDYAYGTLGWKTAVSYIDFPNERSIALAKRMGCVLDEDAAWPGDTEEDRCAVYRHPAPEDL
jgi:RimJ/RimL family protein N-acetyltransferase